MYPCVSAVYPSLLRDLVMTSSPLPRAPSSLPSQCCIIAIFQMSTMFDRIFIIVESLCRLLQFRPAFRPAWPVWQYCQTWVHTCDTLQRQKRRLEWVSGYSERGWKKEVGVYVSRSVRVWMNISWGYPCGCRYVCEDGRTFFDFSKNMFVHMDIVYRYRGIVDDRGCSTNGWNQTEVFTNAQLALCTRNGNRHQTCISSHTTIFWKNKRPPTTSVIVPHRDIHAHPHPFPFTH